MRHLSTPRVARSSTSCPGATAPPPSTLLRARCANDIPSDTTRKSRPLVSCRRSSSGMRKVSFAPDVIVQTIDGEALILKLHDEEVFSLNATGARIAQLIADGQRLDA